MKRQCSKAYYRVKWQFDGKTIFPSFFNFELLVEMWEFSTWFFVASIASQWVAKLTHLFIRDNSSRKL